ncbi:MAG TPA: NADH-quinone oxidoreductase subunit NuoK [Lacipirellulaceae bacterium]|nr:NADH-quinone oxidoreductase subunit NuoK [Lacipirellulaceae bacterium]
MTGDVNSYLAVGACLFVLGAIGFVARRNLILMMLSAELMLHGVSLNLLAFGRMYGRMEGQAFTVFVLTVAACEAGLSLSIILSLYQRIKSLDVELWSALKEPDVVARRTVDEASPDEPELYFPSLTGAGAMPSVEDDTPLAAEVAKGARRKKAGSFRYGDPDPPSHPE